MLQNIFTKKVAMLKEIAARMLDAVLTDYINMACALATRLGILDAPPTWRNEASSGPTKMVAAHTVPVRTAFNHITRPYLRLGYTRWP